MYGALVLAGQRAEGDPLAAYSPNGQKCCLPVAGRPMIERVVAALMAAGGIANISLSVERKEVLEVVPGFDALIEKGRLRVIVSADTPATSVLGALETEGMTLPLLVTTADHALLTPGMVQTFCREAEATGADVVAALVSEKTIRRRFPDSRRTYLRFRDGGFSGANLFAFRTEKSLEAARFWRRVERERKRPWRIARAFGPGLLLLYCLRVLSLDQAVRRISAPLGARAATVVLENAEAAIDVDKPEHLRLVESLLADRNR
jgi:GTP:adenosylcobinamide-phosphate guanylyltransferase